MALPLIPIAVVALIAMAAGGGKKRRPSPAPTPNGNGVNGDIDDGGELYAFGIADIPEGVDLEINVIPGDMIRFDFPYDATSPARWAYTETVDGDPLLVIEEDTVVPDDPTQTAAHYLVDVIVEPVVGGAPGAGRGTVTLDFGLWETDITDPVPVITRRAIIHVA